ncbi:hypothetical protein J6590_095872 [Homalodisca vitripennis]|nr:hypothetical protein J6590_095872 [Homalodisca vitripennis]
MASELRDGYARFLSVAKGRNTLSRAQSSYVASGNRIDQTSQHVTEIQHQRDFSKSLSRPLNL